MPKLTHKLKEFGGRRIVFSLVVLAYLGWLAFINALMFLPALGWLPDNTLSAMGHFGKFLSTGDTHDLIHELVFALIVGIAAVGLLSQLWKPKENFAGQLVALIAWVVMIMTAAFTNNWVPQPLFIIFGGLTILATILHPARFAIAPARRAGRGLFNWFSVARINKVLLSLVAIAAVPLLVFAFTNFNLQIAGGESGGGTGFSGLFGHQKPTHGGDSAIDQELSQDQMLNEIESMATDDEADHDQEHIALGHYRNIAALSFIIILVGLLASFRPKGGRLAAWIAGGLPILLGLASAVLPDAESSLGVSWGIAAMVWGLAFIVVAEVVRRKELKEAQEL